MVPLGKLCGCLVTLKGMYWQSLIRDITQLAKQTCSGIAGIWWHLWVIPLFNFDIGHLFYNDVCVSLHDTQ